MLDVKDAKINSLILELEAERLAPHGEETFKVLFPGDLSLESKLNLISSVSAMALEDLQGLPDLSELPTLEGYDDGAE